MLLAGKGSHSPWETRRANITVACNVVVTFPSTRLVVNGGGHANQGGSIGANIVLVGTELASLSSDTLELLLAGSVCVTDLHVHVFIANRHVVEVGNDLIADGTRLKTVGKMH